MRTYELTLDEHDFFKLQKEFENLADKLDKAKDLILKELASYTAERIIYYISTTVQVDNLTDYQGTDELINSITTSEIFENTIEVYTELAYAKYVEYGTGVRGASNAHPEASMDGWVYNLNRETTGQPAHKFMYNAFQDLSQNYLTIAKQVLEREGII